MKTTTIIFVFTREETLWAINYYKNHFSETVKILAPTFNSQNLLLKENITPSSYYDFYTDFPNYYATGIHKVINEAKKYAKNYVKYFSKITFNHMPVIYSLTSLMEIEFMYVLFSNQYIKHIENKWHPQKYYISNQIRPLLAGGADHAGFVTADLAGRFFLPKNKIVYYNPPVQIDFTILIKNVMPKLSRLSYFFQELKYVIPNCFYQLKNLKNKYTQNNVDFLIISSGLNLYYYRDALVDLLKKTQGLVLTGKQSPSETFQMRALNVSIKKLEAFYNLINLEKIKNTQVTIKNEYTLLTKNLDTRYKNNKRDFILEKSLLDVFQRLSNKYLTKVVKYLVLADAIVGAVNPKLVITTHDPGQSAVPFVQAAKSHKKQSLLLLHGWHDNKLGNEYFSNYLVVWSKKIARWYHKTYNRPLSHIKTAGFPHLDEFIRKNKITLKERKKINNNISKNPTIGILVTLYWPDTHTLPRFFEELFLASFRTSFNGTFLIRSHLHQDVTFIKAIADRYKIRVAINSESSLENFVKKSDVVVSMDTTAIYWPLLLHKPLFYTTPLWGKGFLPIGDYKAAFVPKNAHELFKTLDSIRKIPSILQIQYSGQKKYLKEMLGVVDGSASLRTSHIIEKIISRPKAY